MKIVTMTSSGRKKGNTERLIAMLEEQVSQFAEAKKIPIEIRRVALFEEDIRTCRGCRACFVKGEAFCPLKDSTLAIMEELLKADGLVLASPVYVEDVNGTMKNWIDRMAFVCHRPVFYDKCALLITTSGGSATSRSLHTMNNALSTWGFHVVSMQKYKMGARMKQKEMEVQLSHKVQDAAVLLANSIQNHQAQNPSFLALLSFRIKQYYYYNSSRAGQLDRDYWDKNGWLNHKTFYYMPVHTGRIKRFAAWTLGRVAARFFM